MKWGYVAGLLINFWALYWIKWVTLPGLVGAVLFLPLYYVLYAVLHTFIRQRLGMPCLLISIPFLWTAVEFIRSLGVLGFPWTSLAYTQTYYLSLIQFASITSLYGISFWIVSLNVLIWALFLYASNKRAVLLLYSLLLILLLFPWVYGRIVIPGENQSTEKIRVAVVQGNIDPFLKAETDQWDKSFEIYERLSRKAKAEGAQLIIWPETAVSSYLRYTPEYKTRLEQLATELKTPIITGAYDAEFNRDGGYKTYNGVFLISPDQHGPMQRYAKIQLVPFGERVPFTETFPQIKSFLESFELGEGNFSPGKSLVTFHAPVSRKSGARDTIKVPVAVCFESMFSELIRRFIEHEQADIMAIITNDGWFKRSAAPYHHAQAAVFRAIENRISIARAANTGISLFIDTYGRTLKTTPLFEKALLVADISLRNQSTFFTTHGHIFTIACTVMNVFPILIGLFRGEHESSSPA